MFTNLLQAHLCLGDLLTGVIEGTRTSRVKTTAATKVLRSVSSKKKGTRPKEHEVVDLDAEESVAEQVARLLAHQAGARGSSSPETRQKTRQSPRLSARSDKCAGSAAVT